jgi:hypothetical protein
MTVMPILHLNHKFKPPKRCWKRHGIFGSFCETAPVYSKHVCQTASSADNSTIDFAQDATVLVVVAEKKFVAHTDVLIRTSTFFKSALTRKGWRAAQQRVVNFPKHEATAFSIYPSWLYTASIDLGNIEKSALWTKDEET